MHTSINKPLITLNGNILTSGGAGRLAKGQLAFVSTQTVSGGRKALSDFAGLPANTPIQIRLGRNEMPQGLRSNYAAKYETSYFTPEQIVSIKANFPKHQVQKFDELIIGYDGINDDTALNIPEGKSSVIDITLDGKAIEIFAGEKEHTVKLRFGKEAGQTNQEVVRKLVERIKDYKLPRSQKPVSEFLEVSVIDSENEALAGTAWTFSTLTLTDDGSSNATAMVQAQYPSYKVVRTDRTETKSTYTILHPSTVTLSDYTFTEVGYYVKGCADCLDGYDAITGGVVYHVTIEDDGADLSTTVDDLPGTVSGSVVKRGNVDGRGVYSLVTGNALTDAEKATFLAASAVKGTAVIEMIGEIETLCGFNTAEDTAWTPGTTCYKTQKQYTIQLKDNDCGASRLAELQAAYPGLVIEEGVPTGMATQNVTVSTDAELTITVNGVDYVTADAGTTTQTAVAFVAAHAAAILAATGAVVTNPSTNVIRFTDSVVAFPTITSEGQTVGAIDYVTTATTGGCQRVYSTYVTTNLVCEECDDIFLQPFSAQEAPMPYENVNWEPVAETFSEDALMGIRLKGKPFNVLPTELTRDEIPFYETSTRIKSVAGGYREMDYLNITPAYNFDELFKITRLSRAVDRDALGVNFFPAEEVSRAHYLGEVREKNNLFAKANLGEESLIKFNAQYVVYSIEWQDNKLSQAAGGRSNITHCEQIVVEFGKEANIEDVLNKLAAKAGVAIVKATAV